MTSARSLGLTVTGTSGGQELVLCPWHDDKTPSSWWNPAKDLFYCAVCGVGYNLKQMVEKLGLDAEEIEEDVEVLQDYDFITADTPLELGTPVGAIVPNSYYEKRGIEPHTCLYYNLHFKNGAFPAAVFPVPNVRGDIVGAVYRFVNPKGNRYVKVGRMTPVWPMTFLPKFKEGEVVFVCEGVFSALRLHSHSKIGDEAIHALSLFGAKANQEIVDVLSTFKPVFLYDHDKAGIQACKKMRRLNPAAYSFTLSTAPDDMNKEQLNEMMVKLFDMVF